VDAFNQRFSKGAAAGAISLAKAASGPLPGWLFAAAGLAAAAAWLGFSVSLSRETRAPKPA